MPVYSFDIPKGNDLSGSFEEIPEKHNSLIELSVNFDPNKPTHCNQYVLPSKESEMQRDESPPSAESVSNLSTISNTVSEKSNCVQLYKPIYVARCSKNVPEEFSYDEGDEFELINKVDEEFLHAIHLRTNTQCTIPRTHLYLDPGTPLRLGSDDRGVVQRCLLQYNVPGAYLIRRSKNEPNAFVLSISQISNQRNAEDWHYLIRIHRKTHRFYFAQESKLKNISFTSFQKLIHDENVLKLIPLSKIIPFRIEFEEDLWHIPQRHLTLERRIGKGEFGEVWRAIWKNGDRSIPVAVKKLHPLRQNKLSMNNFIREIETMKALRNNYIVALYGVAQDLQANETLLITELMESGDLKKWLKSCPSVPDETKIISFAFDICRGMAFLEQKSRVHRDLACRNLLLSAEGKTVKIADFGLSTLVNKDDFAQRKEAYVQKLPIRWTAPEVLCDRTVYSIKSDVWSFGIVLIEIWLKGIDPYPEEKEFSAIRTLVQNGYVHKKPLQCSNQFYNRLILPCLCFKPNERPYFKELVELLRHWNKEKAEYDRLNSLSTEFSV
jgi:tRNA A-37 threonylcarbamoyl transferase component Bud32